MIQWPWAGFLVALALLVPGDRCCAGSATQPPLAETAWRVAVMTLGVASLALLAAAARGAPATCSGALVCAGLIGYALYAQYVLGLEPCPLCVFQRVAVIALRRRVRWSRRSTIPGAPARSCYAVLTLVVARHRRGGRDAARLAAVAAARRGAGVRPGPQLHAGDAAVHRRARRRCSSAAASARQSDWRFLGLSMPAWTLVFFVTMIVAALALIDRD